MFRNLLPIWIMLLYVLFLQHNQSYSILHYFIILLHLISSFLLTRSLLVSHAYVSIKPIDCILSSSFELKAILFIFSVETLYLSLSCVFNIDLLLFMNSVRYFLRLFLSRWFTLFSSLVAPRQFL